MKTKGLLFTFGAIMVVVGVTGMVIGCIRVATHEDSNLTMWLVLGGAVVDIIGSTLCRASRPTPKCPSCGQFIES